MKETKRRIVKDVAEKIDSLPEDKQQYVLGIMDGILISSGNTRRNCEEDKNSENREEVRA